MIPYFTFPKTYVQKSSIVSAGVGLFTDEKLKKFDWIGFYPGVLSRKASADSHPDYTMGTRYPDYCIYTDKNEKCGVHLVNEGNNQNLPNVWYVKLENKLCLYFAGREIEKGEELLTCYSDIYSRNYSIMDASKCSDPRCKEMSKLKNKHRDKSLFYKGWKQELKNSRPKKLKPESYVLFEYLI